MQAVPNARSCQRVCGRFLLLFRCPVYDWNGEWHWHHCSIEGCNATDEAEHTFVDGKCSECGYEKPHEHNRKTEWEYNGTKHWHDCRRALHST